MFEKMVLMNLSIQKQTDHKKLMNTKQMNRVQNNIWKYKAIECWEIHIGEVCTCLY